MNFGLQMVRSKIRPIVIGVFGQKWMADNEYLMSACVYQTSKGTQVVLALKLFPVLIRGNHTQCFILFQLLLVVGSFVAWLSSLSFLPFKQVFLPAHREGTVEEDFVVSHSLLFYSCEGAVVTGAPERILSECLPCFPFSLCAGLKGLPARGM